MNNMHVKRGDTVVVISGKEKTAKGKVLVALPKKGRVVVENVNMVTRHTKPKKQGEPGGRMQKPAPLDASNVMLFCAKCNKGVRVGHVIEGDKKKRVCRKCGASFD